MAKKISKSYPINILDKIFLRKGMVMKKRILTGLKPTGELTLGNYIGAIRQLVEMQNDDENELLLRLMSTLYQHTLIKELKVMKSIK